MNDKKITGFDYLWCALYACAAFAIELLLVAMEGKLGIDINNSTNMQMIIHWRKSQRNIISVGKPSMIISNGQRKSWKHMRPNSICIQTTLCASKFLRKF